MAKTRLFISFDYDHDQTLKTFLVGQAKHADSPLADWSVKEHIVGDWKAQARTRIRATDAVCVICGHNTDTAVGVSAELMIARDEEKPYFHLRGYSSGPCKKPKAALPTDKVYDWTWENLKILVGGGR